ncbi:MAG: CPBP family intramembrane metalloprotease [Clostridiales bacterium]|jgi:membrane protease YdiL (CAAX protease family)|nr:CPBP family intramembrane metalloprotease [Clostridiales bacterium]
METSVGGAPCPRVNGRNIYIGLSAAVLITAGFTFALPTLYSLDMPAPFRITTLFAVQAFLFVVAVFCNCAIERRSFADLGFTKNFFGKQLAYAVIIFALLCAVFVGVPLLIGMRDIFGSPDNPLFAVPYCFAVGFAEETLFCGYILKALQRLNLPKIAVVAVSSLLFGAWHFILSGNALQVLSTSAIRAVLAVFVLYGRKCTTLSVSVAHGAYDSVLRVLAVLL